MTPETWFEYVFYTVMAIGCAAIILVMVAAFFGIFDK